MPGERTLYRKIQVILDYVKEGKHEDQEALLEYIYSRSPTNFIYYWRDKTTDRVEHDYSKRSITSVIQLCGDLQLISKKDLSLTKTGIAASDPRRFPTIIGRQTTHLLEKKNIPLISIRQAINETLGGGDPKPPTAVEIWARLDGAADNVDFQQFRQLINLLGQSNVLLMSQKRIYLPRA